MQKNWLNLCYELWINYYGTPWEQYIPVWSGIVTIKIISRLLVYSLWNNTNYRGIFPEQRPAASVKQD